MIEIRRRPPPAYRSNYLGTCTSQGNYRVTRRWDCAWRPGAGGKGGPCSWAGRRDAGPYAPRGGDFCGGNHRRKSRCRLPRHLRLHCRRHRRRWHRCLLRHRHRWLHCRSPSCCSTIYKNIVLRTDLRSNQSCDCGNFRQFWNINYPTCVNNNNTNEAIYCTIVFRNTVAWSGTVVRL